MIWLLALTQAFAVDVELEAEIGTQPTRGDSMERFGEGHTSSLIGGRAGLAFTDALTVQLAGHHSRRGADWLVGNEFIGAAGLFTTDMTAGLEAVFPVNEMFAAGVVGSGGLMIGRARIDDKPDVEDSNVEFAENSLAPMFRTAAVLRFTVPDSALPIPIQLRTSLGYQWSAPLDFDTLGDVAVRGLSFRLGLGIQL